MTKDQKKAAKEHLDNVVSTSESMVFVHYSGLTGNASTDMRAKLQTEDVSYEVVKKTLLKRALQDSSITGEMPEVDGPIAIAYAADLTAPAREVYAFTKEFKNSLSIVGGVFEGRFLNQAEMMEIATIPPTPVLRGMFVNVINSPIQGLAIVLNAIAEKKSA